MLRRIKSKQTIHDKKVREVANRYKRNGWKVDADIPGFSKPKTVFGKRPDLSLRKGNKERLIEIETSKSMKTDKAQRASFQRYANLKRNRDFRTLIAKKSRK